MCVSATVLSHTLTRIELFSMTSVLWHLLGPSWTGPASLRKAQSTTTSSISACVELRYNTHTWNEQNLHHRILFIPSSVFYQGHKAAVCRDNVTDLPNEDAEGGQLGSSVEAFLCQSTIIPSDGRGLRTALSSQSISLADTFQGERNDSIISIFKLIFFYWLLDSVADEMCMSIFHSFEVLNRAAKIYV